MASTSRALARGLLMHVTVPLTAGVALYLVWRPNVFGLSFFGIVRRLSLRGPPRWFLDHAADALWAYAVTAFVALMWASAARSTRLAWLAVALGIILAFELLQLTSLVPGTFDPIDLAASSAAFFCALVSTSTTLRERKASACETV